MRNKVTIYKSELYLRLIYSAALIIDRRKVSRQMKTHGFAGAQIHLLLGQYTTGVFGEKEEEEGGEEELEQEAHFPVEELSSVFLPNASKSDGLYFLQEK